jgi:pimeloyl-CoA synthetase
MRAPGTQPDLSTVVDSLRIELKKISGVEKLINNFSSLKTKYSWSLLNKGVHEDESQPEFERKDITELITLVQSIEENVSFFRFTVARAEEISK